MKKQIAARIDEIVRSYNLSEKELVVFGANTPSSLVINCLLNNELSTSYVVDNNKFVVDTLFEGVPVYKPEQKLIPFNDNVVIFLSSKHYESMKQQLEKMNYKENRHFFQVINLNSKSDFDFSLETFEKHQQKVLKGLKVYEALAAKYQTDLIMVYPFQPNGDLYMICSYLNKYVEHSFASKEYVLTVNKKTCELTAKLFNIKNIVMLSEEDNQYLASLANFMPENVRILSPHYNYQEVYRHLEGYNELTFIQEIKHGIMNLPQDIQPEYPIFRENNEQIHLLCEKLGIEKANSVILAPYANSFPLIRNDFWELLVKRFKDKGMKVFTNCGAASEVAIKGTERIFFDFKDAVSISEYAGTIISYRSGFSEIIARAKCKKIIIYPQIITGRSSIRTTYGMEDCIYEQSELYQIVNDFSSPQKLVNEIDQYVIKQSSLAFE